MVMLFDITWDETTWKKHSYYGIRDQCHLNHLQYLTTAIFTGAVHVHEYGSIL